MDFNWYDPVSVKGGEGIGNDGVQFLTNLMQMTNLTIPKSDMYHTSLVSVTFRNNKDVANNKDVHVIASTVRGMNAMRSEQIILWDTYFYEPATEDLIPIKRLQAPTQALNTLIDFECYSKPVINLIAKESPNETDDVAIMVQWAKSLLMVDYKKHPLGNHITRYWLDRYAGREVLDQIPAQSSDGELALTIWQQEAIEKRLFVGLGYEDQTLLNKKWPHLFHSF